MRSRKQLNPKTVLFPGVGDKNDNLKSYGLKIATIGNSELGLKDTYNWK